MRYDITTLDGSAAIELHLEGLELPGIDPTLVADNPIFSFPCTTYINLYRKVDVKGVTQYESTGVLNGVNNFFASLEDYDLTIIASAILYAHRRIVKLLSSQGGDMEVFANEVLPDISQVIAENFMAVSIFPKIDKFVREHVDIQLVEGWGHRPIDIPPLTYNYDEIVGLHQLVILSKILTPLFGAIYKLNPVTEMVEHATKVQCIQLMSPLINIGASAHKDKLYKYIRASIKKGMNETTSMLHGQVSKNHMETILLYTPFLVRNAINYDLYYTNGKLIATLRSFVNKTINEAEGKATKKNMVVIRKEAGFVNSEESNQSQLEIDSVVSPTTLDYYLIAKTFAPAVALEKVATFDLNVRVHKQLVKHIIKTTTPVNKLSLFVVQTMFCESLGGIANINYLGIKEMAHLLAVAQQMCAVYGYSELACAMSVVPTGRVKAPDALGTVDPAVAELTLNYDKVLEFKKYMNIVVGTQANIKKLKEFFKERMKEIVVYLANTELLFNNAPAINEQLELPDNNGKPALFSITVMTELYKLMSDCWEI